MTIAWRRTTILAVVGILILGHVVNEIRFFSDIPWETGKVVAVESVLPNERGIVQVATVVLNGGSSVKAEVLPKCHVISGQAVRLIGGRTSYFERTYLIIGTE